MVAVTVDNRDDDNLVFRLGLQADKDGVHAGDITIVCGAVVCNANANHPLCLVSKLGGVALPGHADGRMAHLRSLQVHHGGQLGIGLERVHHPGRVTGIAAVVAQEEVHISTRRQVGKIERRDATGIVDNIGLAVAAVVVVGIGGLAVHHEVLIALRLRVRASLPAHRGGMLAGDGGGNVLRHAALRGSTELGVGLAAVAVLVAALGGDHHIIVVETIEAGEVVCGGAGGHIGHILQRPVVPVVLRIVRRDSVDVVALHIVARRGFPCHGGAVDINVADRHISHCRTGLHALAIYKVYLGQETLTCTTGREVIVATTITIAAGIGRTLT